MPDKAKILIVDDEPEIVNVLKEFLALKGYSVMGASSGEEALSILERERPECVLLDVMMPGMRGTEAAKIIKIKYPSVKVVILTGFLNYADSLVKEHLLEAVFKKPVSLQELANKLSEIINSKQKGKIQARILVIKAKLLFMERSWQTYSFLNEYFKQLSAQGKDYELNVSTGEEDITEKLAIFKPDLLVVNAAVFKDCNIKTLPKILEKDFSPNETIVYNVTDASRLPPAELERLAKSIETSCLKNGLVEIRWVEI
jgi:CheY-like chemotaxis protein